LFLNKGLGRAVLFVVHREDRRAIVGATSGP
jgi:hypothetical protein